MKLVVLILSFLLIITGCNVESASNSSIVENDEYSDGIYLFFADCNENLDKICIKYFYKENNQTKEEIYWSLPGYRVTDIFKVDIEKLELIRVYFYPKSDENEQYYSALGNLDKTSFDNMENGLYVAEFFGYRYATVEYTETYLRKTKSLNYYLNNESFYEGKKIIFIKNNYKSNNNNLIPIGHIKINSNYHYYYMKLNDIRGFVYYNLPEKKQIGFNGESILVDYSTLKFNNSIIDLTQLKSGYYYAELDNDGNFVRARRFQPHLSPAEIAKF